MDAVLTLFSQGFRLAGMQVGMPSKSFAGRAFITGRHEFLLDSRDPLGSGFLV
jgi:proline racemase